MAVDTAAKRFSAINISQPWRGVAALPDGLIGQGDRQAVAFLYSGILAGGAVVQPPQPETPQGGLTVPTTFTRKKWKELKALIAAEEAAAAKAAAVKNEKAKDTLLEAAGVAKEVINAVWGLPREAEFEVDALTRALEAAASASRMTTVIKQAALAVRIAERIKSDLDEEEEAIAFLLLH